MSITSAVGEAPHYLLKSYFTRELSRVGPTGPTWIQGLYPLEGAPFLGDPGALPLHGYGRTSLNIAFFRAS
jgi:hypothetical protein